MSEIEVLDMPESAAIKVPQSELDMSKVAKTTFDDFNKASDSPQDAATEPAGENSWYWEDGVAGKGDKPDWFNNDTFKSIAAQAKAQGDARKALGGFTGAPETYKLNAPEEAGLSEDDPMLQDFKTVCKDSSVNQEFFDKALNVFVEHAKLAEEEDQKEKQAFAEEQVKQLGANAEERIEQIKQWGVNNLSEENYQFMKDLPVSAKSVKFFESFRDKVGIGTQIKAEADNAKPRRTRAECRAVMATAEYMQDPVLQKNILEDYRQLDARGELGEV